jgi:CRP/FNR family transcriptional regulator, dissimilatory nitrate respiration regulator
MLDDQALGQVRRNHLFAALTEGELERCLRHARVLDFASGQIIFNQGDTASRFFMVLTGIVRLYRTSAAGEEKIIDLVQPGALFAEAVFFMGGRYPVHAAALERVCLISFDFADLADCLKNNTALAFRMMAGMSKRIHDLVNEIDRLTLGTACQRLAFYLLEAAQDNPSPQARIQLKVPKNVIASRIGVKPETLSRLFAKFKDEQVLEVQGDTLVLLDPLRLRSLLDQSAR